MLEESVVGMASLPQSEMASAAYSDRELLRKLIREAALEAGLGQQDRSVPLADIVERGATVLIKPNWVLHENRSGATMDCMVTHPAFILAALCEVLAARPGRVLIADAPIQGADFDRLVLAEWRREVASLAGETPVEVVDLRNTVVTRVRGVLTPQTGRRDRRRSVLFDLGSDSLLEPITLPSGRFRNTSYNPDEMAKVQRPGVHEFLLCKEPFEADVILNLPKLKAHAKAGVTAALKNLVGLNADKNYLPHHRVGGSTSGGDCYEGRKPFKRLSERLLDEANRRLGRRISGVLSKASWAANAVHGGDLEGKWAGNDTCWRMVLDLNRILLYGDADGVMHDTPLRRIYSLTDGIVAGDRNGPLAPEPVSLGVVTFASNSVHADAVHLALMGFDLECVPLVREAFGKMRWRLTENARTTEVRVSGRSLSLGEVAASAPVPFRPPDGWVGRMNLPRSRS